VTDFDASLSYLPELDGQVTADRLLGFLENEEPEGQILEYKGNLDAKKLVPTIGAFANGYGGYLLVGVPEVEMDGRTVPGAPTGLRSDAASSLRRKCRDSLDPPFTIYLTDIVLPTVGTVLLVRVPPLPQLRPVVVDHRVWVRDGDQTVPASRNEIRRLCLEAPALAGSSAANPANLTTASGFINDLGDPWITIRGICSAAPPVGAPRPEVDRSVRSRVVASLNMHSVSRWVDKSGEERGARREGWVVSGVTTSAQYDTTLVALADGRDVIRARVRFGIGHGLSPLSGLWCVADLSQRPTPDASTGTSAPLLSFVEMERGLATALATAEHVVSELANEYEHPRPRLAHVAAGVIGDLAGQLDLSNVGAFSDDPRQRLQHGWQFTEPTVQLPLGELDAEAIADRYLDRFLLDIGAL
jgi:hypothetical protein